MLTEVKNNGAMSGSATSAGPTSSAGPALPGGQEPNLVLVHSAWAGWHYEGSFDEAAAGA